MKFNIVSPPTFVQEEGMLLIMEQPRGDHKPPGGTKQGLRSGLSRVLVGVASVKPVEPCIVSW